MAYADSLLTDDEHVVYRTKQHPLSRLAASRWGIFLVALAIAGIVLIVVADITGDARTVLGWAVLACLVAGAALIGWNFVVWSQEDYLVTSRRVMKVGGVLTKRSMDSSLEKINDAILEQSLWGRMFDWGDLRILTAAEEIADDFRMLNHAPEFKKVMLTTKHDLEEGTDIRRQRALEAAIAARQPAPLAAPEPPAAQPPAATAPPPVEKTAEEKLRSLAQLRDDGVITPEDYQAKKAELLDQL